MNRLIVWLASTAAGLVLLFSYHTSTSGPDGSGVVTGLAPVGVLPETAAPDPAPTAAASAGASAAAAPPSPAAVKQGAAPSPAASPAVPPQRQSPAAAAVAPRPSPSPATAPAPRKTAAPATRVVNGAPADTRYGPVQVQIKVQGSRIVSSNAIAYPQEERRDREINGYAIPQLNDETVRAQSANIDTVSGATYTSDGYRQSLQSAIDAANR